jgi:hypothetical protein
MPGKQIFMFTGAPFAAHNNVVFQFVRVIGADRFVFDLLSIKIFINLQQMRCFYLFIQSTFLCFNEQNPHLPVHFGYIMKLNLGHLKQLFRLSASNGVIVQN